MIELGNVHKSFGSVEVLKGTLAANDFRDALAQSFML